MCKRAPWIGLGVLLAASWSLAAASRGELYREFRDPPASYSLMPYWYWNGRINASDTRRELEAMLAQGVHQAIAFPWDGMEQRYLSEEFWKQVGAALDIARELHFTLNFADEYDWPSGHAWTSPYNDPELSAVLRAHPEYRMQRLEYSESLVEGGSVWTRPADTKFAVAGRENEAGALVADSLAVVDTAEWRAPSGRWLVTAYKLVPAVGAHNTRVDLLNADAVRAYINLVYGEYARRFPQHLGKTMQLTVADHEGTYGVQIAYTPGLLDAEMIRKLPLLVHDSTEPRTAKAARSEYLRRVSERYVSAFTGQVARWCAAHGLKHGTSAYEEQLYIQVNQAGNMFDMWRSGSVVEIDALLERARMPIDFKEAVSVAHFDHKPLLVENQGLQGHGTFFSLEKARLGSNMALLWGANFLIPYFDYDQRKITWPPQWFLSQPFWRYFHHYADYVRRVQFMNAQGRHVAPVLIYYPLETAFANSSTLFLNKQHRDLFWNNAMDNTQNYYSALQLELARRGWDYHIVDATYLQQAAIHGRELQIGEETFGAILVPPITDIDPRSEAKLEAFERAGGAVLRVPMRDRKPFMDRLNYSEQIEVPADIRGDLEPVLSKLDPPVCPFHADHIYCSCRTDGATRWYWIVNDSGDSRTLPVTGGPYEKWDAETGERSPVGSELNFGPWDAYFVVSGATARAPEQAAANAAVIDISKSGWKFTPEAPSVEVPYAKDRSGTAVWLAPERASLRNWWIRGPFPFDDHRGFFTAYPPETQPFDSAEWKRLESPDYVVTLPRERGIYYAFTYVDSASDREDELVAAFADSMTAWVNGTKALSVHRHPKWSLLRDPWAERAPVHLHKGRNEVLLKIESSLMVRTAFSFRIGTPREETCDLTVSQPPGTVSPAPRCFDQYHPVSFRTGTVPFTLQSWTDSALAHYSGTAIYETSFDLPPDTAGKKVTLDLGAVGVAAEVWVNGIKSGERVWRPFTFDVTKQARPGRNALKVRVANSDAGRQAQGGTIYPRGSWGLHYTTELDRVPTIRPNGLEGPVRIVIGR